MQACFPIPGNNKCLLKTMSFWPGYFECRGKPKRPHQTIVEAVKRLREDRRRNHIDMPDQFITRYWILADEFRKAGDDMMANEVTDELFEQFPDNVAVLKHIVKLAANDESHDLVDSLAPKIALTAVRATQLAPDDPETWYLLALTHQRLGRSAENAQMPSNVPGS